MEGGCSVETTLLLPSNCPLDPLDPGRVNCRKCGNFYRARGFIKATRILNLSDLHRCPNNF